MRDVVAFAFLVIFLVCAWGVIRPYEGFSRKHFAWSAVGAFILFVVAVPPVPNGKGQAVAAAVDSDASDKIATKAQAAADEATTYTKTDDADVLKAVGQPTFPKLTELERGAYYAAAESSNCDRVDTGAIDMRKSRKGQPVWFVDCANGNRFLVAGDQAQQALARKNAHKLAENDLGQNCTRDTISECLASVAQKSAKEAEVVSYCDMIVEKALISDPDMAWGWQYGLGEGDTLKVARDFTAQNAFGAKLKHRYFCTYDAAKNEVVKLTIQGPFGSRRVI